MGKPFSHPRWSDPPIGRAVGHQKITKEEKKDAKIFLDKKIKEHQKLLKKNE